MMSTELIKVGSIMQKFAMCCNKHRQDECEYCNCKNCVLNITDDEFELMMKYIQSLKKLCQV